jgi:hypothetical protein
VKNPPPVVFAPPAMATNRIMDYGSFKWGIFIQKQF